MVTVTGDDGETERALECILLLIGSGSAVQWEGREGEEGNGV